MFARSLLTVAAVLVAPLVSAADLAKHSLARPSAGAAPDMSAYGCVAAVKAAHRHTLHIGQVIEGTYYEWDQTYVTATPTGPERLGCISLMKPDARALTVAEAVEFLGRSAAIGAPATAARSSATGLAKGQGAPAVAPRDVQPEPRKRVLPSSPANGLSRSRANVPGATDVQPSVPQAPPTPAEHHPVGDVAPPPGDVLKPQARSFTPQAITGPDPRVLVPGATATTFPYNTIGYLTATYPNGQSYRCTGFLVSPYVVLTAGHCVHNNSRGGWARSVEFSPAMYQESAGGTVREPFPSNAAVANLKTTQEWTQISGPDSYEITQYRYDFAAVQFRTPFTFTSTFMAVVYNDTGSASTAGYPANVGGVSRTVYGMYADSGDETRDSVRWYRSSDVREFDVVSSGGDSGSPFFRQLNAAGPYALAGSLSYGNDSDTAAGGPWFDSWNRDLLTSWMTWTPGGTSTPTASAPMIELAAPASLGRPSAQSYLRFYNQGTTAGTATVKLANGVTGADLYTWTSAPIVPGGLLQYGLAEIEFRIPAWLRASTYSIAVQSSFNGYFQHVIWSPDIGAITNLSTCNAKSTTDSRLLMDVHSGRVSGYPSFVVVHNTGSTMSDVQLGFIDGRNGTRLGGIVLTRIPANGQVTRAMTDLERSAGIVPPSDMPHYVVKVESNFTGYLQHLVNNSAVNFITDMSGMCGLSSS